MRREQPPCLVLALQAPLGHFPHYKYSVALTCVLFLSNKAPAAASELHGLRRKPTKRSSRAPHTGSGTRHVGGADGEEVLVQHAETGGLLPAAPGRGGTFWGPHTPQAECMGHGNGLCLTPHDLDPPLGRPVAHVVATPDVLPAHDPPSTDVCQTGHICPTLPPPGLSPFPLTSSVCHWIHRPPGSWDGGAWLPVLLGKIFSCQRAAALPAPFVGLSCLKSVK